MKNRIHIFAIGLLMVCAMTSAQAVGLNEIELSSYLNQTLDAKIGLSGLKSGDLDSINVRIHPTDGVTNISPSMLVLEIKDDGNRHYIQITSKENIREPIISFALEVTWVEGRIIREYSVLIDPKN